MVQVDNPAPLPDTPFRTADGSAITLQDFAGQVVLVNFWATWCAPCVEEMPALDALAAATADAPGIAIVAISEDRKPMEVAPQWLADQGLTNLAVYGDEGQALFRALGLRGMPTTLLIGPDGAKLAYKEGIAAWDDPAFVRALRQLAGG